MKIFKKESFGLKRKGELVFHSCVIYKKIKEILYISYINHTCYFTRLKYRGSMKHFGKKLCGNKFL